MASEQRWEQLFNYEPHPVTFELEAKEIEQIKEALSQECESYIINETQSYHNISNNITVSTDCTWQIQTPILTISNNRSNYIHRCINCGTANEKKGVGIHNILCDACSSVKPEELLEENQEYGRQGDLIIGED